MVASRVEIGTPRGYLKPYLDTIYVYGLSFYPMHVLDYILDRLSGLFRFNRYSLVEKAYSVLFHVIGLSLRDVSDRY